MRGIASSLDDNGHIARITIVARFSMFLNLAASSDYQYASQFLGSVSIRRNPNHNPNPNFGESGRHQLLTDAHCCHMNRATCIKHPVMDRVKPLSVIL